MLKVPASESPNKNVDKAIVIVTKPATPKPATPTPRPPPKTPPPTLATAPPHQPSHVKPPQIKPHDSAAPPVDRVPPVVSPHGGGGTGTSPSTSAPGTASPTASVPTPTPTASPTPTPTPTPKPSCAHPSVPAAIRRQAELEMPDDARMQGATGTTKVRVVLNEQGQVVDATVAIGSGNASLDRAAIRAARETTYTPDIVNCAPTAGAYYFVAEFKGE